jgi:Spy/CpxP family protein refolding chaperone
MNRFSRFAALTLGLAIAGAAGAQAQESNSATTPEHAMQQPQGRRAPDPQQQLQHLTKQLQLSADQQAKIGPILQQRDQQIQALRADSSLSQADRRAKLMSLAQDSSKQIDAVLTHAQRDQMKAMREKAMEHMQERRGQHVPSSSSSS